MKQAFLLLEVLIASLVILMVLSSLLYALTAFMNGSRSIEIQQAALTLARVEMARIENLHNPPEPGRTMKTDSLWNRSYIVDTTVSPAGDNCLDILVAVASDEIASVELSRRIYFQ